MVFTREITASHDPISSIFTVAAPVTHQASNHRECDIDIMDFQVVCSSGTLVIGSVQCFLSLIAIAFGISIAISSSLLSCGATYLFDQSKWRYKGLIYLISPLQHSLGLLRCPHRYNLYIFNVKMWRIFVVNEKTQSEKPKHLKIAIPLIKYD
ncbi:hypothetical protein THRCLA_21014 [Thraustotheca clavata]|uniref:Transmembrane protein n=1 Tax=Thraustotheca clavata TaxID=74557 RepID=A0A1W0A118_9STRA|nr:hypothetical protein THRCLA_21014 [Thraustotheca clavata]